MEDFGIKELYDINIRATDDIIFCGHSYKEDEIILRLDRAQIAVLNASRARLSARGGYGNRVWITWEDIQPLRMQIQEGVISKNNLALLTNNNLEISNVSVPVTEKAETTFGKNLNYSLRHIIATNKPYFIYDDKGNLTDLEITNGKLQVNHSKSDLVNFYLIDYYASQSNVQVLKVGKHSIMGFLKLEAKTRVKDDIDGQERTGVFVIPKIKIMSDLSMRLGDTVEPYAYTFVVEGEPVGARGEEYVCDLVFLDEDFDADI